MEAFLKILIVEDNPGDLVIVKELLRSSGIYHQIRFAATLSESLKLCKMAEFDIILLDLGLPDSMGLNTLKKLRAAAQKCPLVIMTGLDDEDTALQSLREGAQDYLVKNRLTRDTIERTIKYSIERKRIDEVIRQNSRRFSILSAATGALNECEDTHSIFRIICANLSMLLDNAGVVAMEYSAPAHVSFSGTEWLQPYFEEIRRITNYDLNNPVFEINKESRVFMDTFVDQKLKDIKGGLYEAFQGLIEQSACQELEKLLGIKYLYTVGFHQHKLFYGGFMIFMSGPVSEADRSIIETISNQTALNIHRRNIERHLRQSENSYKKLNIELEQKVRERTSDLLMVNKRLQKELSDRIQAEQTLMKNEVQLRELNATKDKFFNIVAHDLKNPFTSLLGSTELLFQNIDKLDPDNIRKLAVILNDSAKSGYAILQNLLDWSRSQTGQIRINPENINLKQFVEENILNQELFLTNKNITIETDVDSKIQIFTDKNMLNTVLRNLISNALKFSYRGGKIIVRANAGNEHITLSVKDFGTGIPVKHLDSLFRIDSRYSLPGTEKEQGTGLGLKLCREFAEKMHGFIRVESEENKGSEFIFEFPSSL